MKKKVFPVEYKKKSIKHWKKYLILFSVFILLIVLIILFVSPITKYLVEKYDVKYTGREIKMKRAYVNPFTGHIHFTDFIIYERGSDSVFFSAKGLSADISLLKLFRNTFQVNSLIIEEPRGIISQNKDQFNFSDFIEKFSPQKIQPDSTASSRINILNIDISNGEFRYVDQVIPVNYWIRKVNIKSSGMSWNQDTVNVKFSFEPGTGGGDASGEFTLNLDNLEYRIDVLAHKLDMNIIEQYLKDLLTYGNFSANVDLGLNAKGNLGSKLSINTKGSIAVNDFHFGKNPKEDYASFEKITVGIKELDPANKKYFFDSVLLVRPYLKYEQFDYLDNIQRMVGKNAFADPSKFNLIIEIVRYIKVIFRNFLSSDYTINSLEVKDGNLHFNDYSISEKFSAALNPLHIKADSVDNTKGWVNVYAESGIKPFGASSASVSMNPKDNKDFNFIYSFKKIPAAVFNPYLITHTSFPLDRGTVEMSGNWNVRNDYIQSTNHFLVIDPRVTKRIRKKDASWMPLPLIMSMVRERGNVIDYDIPISGSMKDPKFHLRDVLQDLLGNIFIKPSSTPYRMEVKNIENEIEKMLSLNWPMRQSILRGTQEKFATKIADFLKDNPEVSISIQPVNYAEKEKEYILFYEAKKKYFFAHENKPENTMTESDSLSIEKMSSKDSLFVRYLDQQAKDSMLFTIQEKCSRLVDGPFVKRKFDQLVNERKKEFMEFFKKNKTEKQVNFFPDENSVPFNGFSYYRIEYKGAIPQSLLNAYDKLNELNSEPPREKYLKSRNGKTPSPEMKTTRADSLHVIEYKK